MNTNAEFKKVKTLVEQILAEDVRARNDDKWLTYKVMRCFTNIYIPFDDFNKLPSFETVKRTRAHIQNVEKRYPPTEASVIKKRHQRSADVAAWSRTGGTL